MKKNVFVEKPVTLALPFIKNHFPFSFYHPKIFPCLKRGINRDADFI